MHLPCRVVHHPSVLAACYVDGVEIASRESLELEQFCILYKRDLYCMFLFACETLKGSLSNTCPLSQASFAVDFPQSLKDTHQCSLLSTPSYSLSPCYTGLLVTDYPVHVLPLFLIFCMKVTLNAFTLEPPWKVYYLPKNN